MTVGYSVYVAEVYTEIYIYDKPNIRDDTEIKQKALRELQKKLDKNELQLNIREHTIIDNKREE